MSTVVARVIEEPIEIKGLSEIAHQYDGFIVDLWGVIHDGYKLFDDVLPCLQQLKSQGKTVVFLSNAPRSSGVVIEQLTAFGLPQELYSGVVTSGDLTLDYVRRHEAKTYFHIGLPEKDSSLLVGIGKNPAHQMHESELIIASNFDDARPYLEDYAEDFDLCVDRGIPMVCANPDLLVFRGDVRTLCAGTLAEDYMRRGGEVQFFGKPHPEIYQQLMSRYGGQSWLAIGDALATDIKGANAAGVDSLFVKSGIHQHEENLEFAAHDAQPRYIGDLLSW